MTTDAELLERLAGASTVAARRAVRREIRRELRDGARPGLRGAFARERRAAGDAIEAARWGVVEDGWCTPAEIAALRLWLARGYRPGAWVRARLQLGADEPIPAPLVDLADEPRGPVPSPRAGSGCLTMIATAGAFVTAVVALLGALVDPRPRPWLLVLLVVTGTVAGAGLARMVGAHRVRRRDGRQGLDLVTALAGAGHRDEAAAIAWRLDVTHDQEPERDRLAVHHAWPVNGPRSEGRRREPAVRVLLAATVLLGLGAAVALVGGSWVPALAGSVLLATLGLGCVAAGLAVRGWSARVFWFAVAAACVVLLVLGLSPTGP